MCQAHYFLVSLFFLLVLLLTTLDSIVLPCVVVLLTRPLMDHALYSICPASSSLVSSKNGLIV